MAKYSYSPTNFTTRKLRAWVLPALITLATVFIVAGVMCLVGNRSKANAEAGATHAWNCSCATCQTSRAVTAPVVSKCTSPDCTCANCTGACGGNCQNDGCSSCITSNNCISACPPYSVVINVNGPVYVNLCYNPLCGCGFCTTVREGKELPVEVESPDVILEEHVQPEGAPSIAPTVAPSCTPTTVAPSCAPATTEPSCVPTTAPTTAPSSAPATPPATTREVVGIRVELTKTDWWEGEKIPCEYIHVFAVYNDGTEHGPVGGYECPEANVGHSAGVVTFHFTWEGFTCTLDVTFMKRQGYDVGEGFNPTAGVASLDPTWEESVSASMSKEAEEQMEPENLQPEVIVEETTAAPEVPETLPVSTEGQTQPTTQAPTTAKATPPTTVAPTTAVPTAAKATPPADTIPETTRVEEITVSAGMDDFG